MSRDEDSESVTAASAVDASEPAEVDPADLKWTRRFGREVRTHPLGYAMLAIFLIAGPATAPFMFPDAPPAAAVIGGLAFGVFAALSAVPQKFI